MSDSRYYLTVKSRNRKVGGIPVSTTTSDSCPESCKLSRKGCYAKYGPLAINWRRLDSGERAGLNLSEFCGAIAGLPDGTLWRHNQAGDLPKSKPDRIDADSAYAIARANTGKFGFTYTHYPVRKSRHARHNRAVIERMNDSGFTVNISADNLTIADKIKKKGIRAPIVAILPANTPIDSKLSTPRGHKVVICPAQTNKSKNCESCRLCARQREVIVGFLAHGPASKTVSQNATLNPTN